MKKEITYFETIKENHTLETFEIVEQKLKETGIKKVVLASTTGRTALVAMEFFSGKGVTLVVIPHQYGFSDEENRFPQSVVEILRENGHEVHFGTMLFHTERLYGSSIPNVIAVAGTGANSDTALVMQAATTRTLKKLRVNEILCKPYNAL